jgi:hypothetical protein
VIIRSRHGARLRPERVGRATIKDITVEVSTPSQTGRAVEVAGRASVVAWRQRRTPHSRSKASAIVLREFVVLPHVALYAG